MGIDAPFSRSRIRKQTAGVEELSAKALMRIENLKGM